MKELKEKVLTYLRTTRYADIILSLWCASSFVGLVRYNAESLFVGGAGIIITILLSG